MLKPNIKYRVTLTKEERDFLQNLVKKGRTAGHRIRHAHMLLALDEIPQNAHWTDAKIGAAYGSQQREVPPVIKIDGEAEAKIIALTCSQPPEGRCRWTLRLLADKVVQLKPKDIQSKNLAEAELPLRPPFGFP